MVSVKDFVSYGNDDQYERVHREALIYELINTYDTGHVDDNGYVSNKLTFGAKKRLRNQIMREAHSLVKENAINGQVKSVNDYDIIAQAFYNVSRPSDNFNSDSIYADWIAGDTDVKDDVISKIESWDNTNVVLLSPYDSMFFQSDVFNDDNDAMGYASITSLNDTNNFESIHLGKKNTSIVSIFDRASMLSRPEMDIYGDVSKSGFLDINHYIKKADYDSVYKFLVEDKHSREITSDERDFMRQVCELFTENGVDFTIEPEDKQGNRLCLKMPGGVKVRLVDFDDPEYNGRIYDNGMLAYFGLEVNRRGSGKNTVKFNVTDYIDNNDRLNMLRWYFGFDADKRIHIAEQGSKEISSTHYVGESSLLKLPNRNGALYYATTSVAKSRTDKSSVLYKGIDMSSSGRNAVKIMLTSAASANFDSPEVRFSNSIPTVSERMMSENTDSWQAFKASIPEKFLPTNVDDISNLRYYQDLAPYTELGKWIDSSKNNHLSLMNFDDLYESFEQSTYGLKSGPTVSGDDDIDEIRDMYWNILSGDIKILPDDVSSLTAYTSNLLYDSEYFNNIMNVSQDDIALLNDNMENINSDKADINIKKTYIKLMYAKYLHEAFGELPAIQVPNGVTIDTSKNIGFNPEKVAKYVATDNHLGPQKNYDCLRHMLSDISVYDSSWIKADINGNDTYIGTQIKNDLIRYNPDTVIGTIDSSIFDNYGNIRANAADIVKKNNPGLVDKPVTVDMMIYAAKSLSQCGVSTKSISLSIDDNGIIKYQGNRFTKHVKFSKLEDANDNLINDKLEGYIGQIFEPDKYGAISPKYAVDNDEVFVPGYNVYLAVNDADNPKPMSERLRGVGWEKQMKSQISKELHRAVFQIDKEYLFTPKCASLNIVYRHCYDTTMTREAYYEGLAKYENPRNEEERLMGITFNNLITTLKGRCRFSNDVGDGASTMAQSMLENPSRDESKNYDFFYSDLYDNHNIRVLDESYDGIFDPNATGTAKTQGVVRYLADGATFDSNTGKPIPVEYNPTEGAPECALMKDELFRHKYNNTWDRRLMAFSQVLTAWYTPRDVGASMMNIGGLTFDDGYVVSKKFAEKYRVKDSENGSKRALVAQDKLSDMNGNKGVISLVVDPELYSEDIANKLANEYDFSDITETNNIKEIQFRNNTYYVSLDVNSEDSLPLQCAYFLQKEYGVYGFDDVIKVFRDNENLDVVMAPYSGMSRGNAGSVATLMEHSEKSKDLVLNDNVESGGMGYTDLIVVDMLADVKTHFYDDDAIREGKGRKASGQLAWALQSKGAHQIMNEFYGKNSKAFDNLREYAIAIGFDFNEKFEPIVGYTRQSSRSEKRRLLKLDETIANIDVPGLDNPSENVITYVPAKNNITFNSNVYNAVTSSIMNNLNSSGGFMELPFKLHFNVLDVAKGIYKKDKIPEELFDLQKTGQSYLDNSGNSHDTWGLPLLSASLRSGQTFQDNTTQIHDFTQKYADIQRQAILYRFIENDKLYCEQELAKLHNDLIKVKNGETVDVTLVKDRNSESGYKSVEDSLKVYEAKLQARLNDNSACLEKCIASAQTSLDGITDDIIEKKFNTKHNVIRDEIMTKRLDHSATVVWSADPRLKSDEVSMSFEHADALGLTTSFSYNDVKMAVDAFENHTVLNSRKAETKKAANFDMSFENTYAIHVDVNGHKTYRRVTDIRQLSEDSTILQLSKNASLLVWRDPVLHDGNVRYMKATIDNRLIGCAINPLMDASFDGDFDGDSVAIVALQSEASKKEAFAKFSFERNFLNLGVKTPITNPDNENEVIENGHPLYIQKGLDTAAIMFDNEELKLRRARIEFNINKMEMLNDKYLNHEITDAEFDASFKAIDANGNLLTYKDKETGQRVPIVGKNAVNTMRKMYKAELDDWMHDVLNGIGNDLIHVDTAEHVVASMQHIVDDKAKGSQSKNKDFCNNLGITFECDKDDRAILSSVKEHRDVNGNLRAYHKDDDGNELVPDSYEYNKAQRAVDKAIEETAAYKADNTQLGGVAAQHSVAAFRDIDIHAALEITYPVTQAILQSKHDPKDAKIKDKIIRFWGNDCWNGCKLSGTWVKPADMPDDVYVNLLQSEDHTVETTFVYDKQGNKVPETYYEDGQQKNKLDEDGNVIYKREPVKCSRKDWINQMNGMMKALKVDDSINPDYIENLANIMSNDGSSAVMGVTDFIREKGTLLDKMGYTDRYSALVNQALLSNPQYRTLFKDEPGAPFMSVIGNAVSQIIDIKNAENAQIDAMAAYAEKPKSEKASVRNQDVDVIKANEQLLKAKSLLQNSATFVADSVASEIYGDKQRTCTGDVVNTIRNYRNSKIVTSTVAPNPIGRKDSLLSDENLEHDGMSYMGQTQIEYETFKQKSKEYQEAKAKEDEETLRQARGQAADGIVDHTGSSDDKQSQIA